MHARTQLEPLLRGVSLAAIVAASLTAGPAALAQDTDEEAVPDHIVITGTRLRGVAPVGSPLSTIGSQDMELANETSTARIIQQQPQVFDLGISEASRGQNGGNGNIVYGTGINLRGLGPYATLVLVDGHRAINNNRALDPSSLPALGLQRIEILADGASAIYGSDAVAGVVNLVPVRFQDGGQVFGRYGWGDQYDEHQIGAAWGRTWDGGQAHLAYEHAYRSGLRGGDRDFFREDQTAMGGLDYRSNFCNPGTMIVGGVTYAIPEGGVTPANNDALVAGTQNLCEASSSQYLLPEQTYDNFSFTLNHQLTDRIELVADGFYSERDFYRDVADTTRALTVPNTNPFFVAPPGLSPASVVVNYNFADELRSNFTEGYARNYEVTGGFAVDLFADWTFETLLTYGEGRDYSESRYGLNLGALAAALASTDPSTAFDPFGLGRTNPTVLASLADDIFLAPTNNEFVGFEARLDGALFTIPGGDVLLASGYERQDLDYHAGLARGAPGTPTTFRDFSRSVDSVYAEILVPLVGDGNALPGVRRLDVDIAGRYDNYSDVGSTTNPKVGVTWAPADTLDVRATYGTSLRAPTFAELYGNSNALFGQTYTDPTIPGPRQGAALSGGNLDLSPEEAETWTIGLDYRPAALPGAEISLTYFDIEYEGQIASYLSNLNILSLEDEFVGTGVILRGAEADARVAEILASGIGWARGAIAPPVTLFVDGRTFNLGRSLMSGVDFDARYTWSLADNDLTARLFGSYITDFQSSITPNGTLIDRLDTIFNPHDLKMRGTLTWDRDPFEAYLALNYVGEYTNDLLATPETVDAFVTLDMAASVDIGDPYGDGFTLGLDVHNVFDEDPPYVNVAPGGNGSGGYDATAANPTGRVIGVSVRKRW